jgi:site-specific DNA recombinase
MASCGRKNGSCNTQLKLHPSGGYELFLKLRRKGAVTRELNKRGYRTRKGRLWLDSYVTRILEDTSAKGVYAQNRTKRLDNWKSEPKPESEWGVVQVEPIISEAAWTEVNRIVEEQRNGMVRPGKRPKHIFAGKLRCKCGRSMYVLSSTPKYFCERCRTRIPIVDLEARESRRSRAHGSPRSPELPGAAV